METTEAGLDGKSCESLSDPPEVFFRTSGGREWAPTAGEPARRAVGTVSPNGDLAVVGEPIWSGDGTPAMVCARIWSLFCAAPQVSCERGRCCL